MTYCTHNSGEQVRYCTCSSCERVRNSSHTITRITTCASICHTCTQFFL